MRTCDVHLDLGAEQPALYGCLRQCQSGKAVHLTGAKTSDSGVLPRIQEDS
jgi:hypothetical protein